MRITYGLLALLGLAVALPSQAEELNLVDSETAALVSADLRDLVVDPTTDHVVEPMLPYHLQALLDNDTRDTIHDLGMSTVYGDPFFLPSIITTITDAAAERSPILQSGGLVMARDITGVGFWEVHEPSNDDFHYDLTEPTMESAMSYDLNPLVLLQPYALWDQQAAGYSANEDNATIYEGGDYFVLQENTGPGAPYSLTEYQEFLTNLVGQYPNVTYFEVANEPDANTSGFINNVDDYIDLVEATRSTLGNDVMLLNGGTIGVRNTFWESFFANGGGNSIDVFNVHYNLEKTTVNETFDNFRDTLDDYNDLLANYNPTMPIWITEFGSYADGTTYTEEDQAAWHVKNFSVAASRNVKKVFLDVFGNSTGLGQSALLYRDDDADPWTARLLFYTQKLMNDKLSGFTDCEELVYGEQYQFTVNDAPVYVLWGDDALPEELVGEWLTVTDMYGNVTVTNDLTLTDNPVFVTVDEPVVTTNGRYVQVTVSGEVIDQVQINKKKLSDKYYTVKTVHFYNGYTTVLVLTAHASQAKLTVLRLTEENELKKKVTEQFDILKRNRLSLTTKRAKKTITAQVGKGDNKTTRRFKLKKSGKLTPL